MDLVDTNVLSVGASGSSERLVPLTNWRHAHSDDLFISAITVAEICDRVAKVERMGATSKADRLRGWLELVLHLYGERALPFGVPAARLAGTLMDKARTTGHSPGFVDVAIAATAGSRNLTVLTRNLRHFTPLGVDAINPFESLP